MFQREKEREREREREKERERKRERKKEREAKDVVVRPRNMTPGCEGKKGLQALLCFAGFICLLSPKWGEESRKSKPGFRGKGYSLRMSAS